MPRYNLFIVADPVLQDAHDFYRIAKLVEEMAPDIRAEFLLADRRARGPRWRSLLRRSLTVEINRGRFRPLRGYVSTVAGNDKLLEYRRLDAAGLPLPPWREIRPGTLLDEAEWGPFAVEKPALGKRGAYVRLRRTGRIGYREPAALPEDHPGRRGPMLVQRYIHTGEKPKVTRVLTCCGRTVLAYHQHNLAAAPRHQPHPDYGPISENIVAAAKGNAMTLCDEPDILALAEACHAAFPDTPMVGTDIMREAATGKLWVAEVNRGYCWTLSDRTGKRLREQFGFDFYGQFDGLRRAAEGMIDFTRRLAS